MAMTSKRAILECCGCGGNCVGGCCFPKTYDDPLYPDGVFQNLYWVIDAPGCPELDGKEGIFYPIDPTAPSDDGVCGPCACYRNLSSGNDTVNVTGSFWTDVGSCQQSPCSVKLCFFLSCDSNEPDPTDPVAECCKRFRLVVGIDDATASISGVPTTGGDERCESLKDSSVCAANLFGEAEPISCECAANEGGVTAVFDLSVISFDCDGVIAGGNCDGKPNCCTLFNCDLTGATLSVSPTPPI